jgi:hypothetical protein
MGCLAKKKKKMKARDRNRRTILGRIMAFAEQSTENSTTKKGQKQDGNGEAVGNYGRGLRKQKKNKKMTAGEKQKT